MGENKRKHAEEVAALRLGIELGMTLIDTAEMYGEGGAEKVVADAIDDQRERVFIVTKVYPHNASRTKMPEACERSLKLLKIDQIDLYQLHTGADPKVPFEESIGAIAELRKEGKIRHVGLSNVSVEQLETAQAVVPIVSVQNRYNYTDRSSEEVLRECEREAITFLPWYPLEAGGSASSTGALARIAARHNASSAQIAIAWLLARSPITLPIPGTSSVAHLEENVTAIRIRLSPPELAELS